MQSLEICLENNRSIFLAGQRLRGVVKWKNAPKNTSIKNSIKLKIVGQGRAGWTDRVTDKSFDLLKFISIMIKF